MFGRFFFELRHAASFAERRKTIKNPAKFAVRRHAALAIDVNVGIIDIKAGRDVIFDTFDNLIIKLAVIDRRSKRVEVWHEHINLRIGSVFVGKINHRRISAQKVAESWFFIGADAGQNRLHIIIIVFYGVRVKNT